MARNKLGEEIMSFSIRITKEKMAEFRRVSDALEQNRSGLMRKWIDDYIRDNENLAEEIIANREVKRRVGK